MDWTDPRDDLAWKVNTRWSGQPGMGVGTEVDISKIPAILAPRLIEFRPVDGQSPICRTGMGEDLREAEEFSDEELQEVLDRARAGVIDVTG